MPSTSRSDVQGPGRVVAAALTVSVVCAIALTACGSAGKSGTGSSLHAAGVEFARCMRSHGVSNFPDPGAGGGIQLDRGSGIDPAAPAFRSAQKVCSKLLPGGPVRAPVSAAQKQKLLDLARCMRQHGVTAFPDPTATPPGAGRGSGIAFGAPGAFIAVPSSLVDSPAFNQAAADCGFPGGGR